jgi:hypothetical protein
VQKRLRPQGGVLKYVEVVGRLYEVSRSRGKVVQRRSRLRESRSRLHRACVKCVD